MMANKTIAFGLFLQCFEELKDLIPMYDYDTSDGTEENSYRCTSKGSCKYNYLFKNKVFVKSMQ